MPVAKVFCPTIGFVLQIPGQKGSEFTQDAWRSRLVQEGFWRLKGMEVDLLVLV